MKPIMPTLIGNRAVANKLGGAILSGTMSHAYIIGGPAKSGKHTLAYQIAASLACENKDRTDLPLPCGTCEACRKILSGISPDVILVNKGEESSIRVHVIRDLRSNVLSYPNDLDVKIYIIEEATKMTPEAQNAFLLTLEEPPPYVVFLLLCERPEDMLETIRSRAPTIRTEPLTAEQIEAFLSKNEITAELMRSSPNDFHEIVMASGGRLGEAIELSDPEKRAKVFESRKHARSFVSAMSRRSSGNDTLDIIEGFPQNRSELADRLSLILTALRDIAVLKKSESAQLCFYHDREAALELSDSFSMFSLMSLIDSCEDARRAILRNANAKLTLYNLVIRGNYGTKQQ